MIVSLSGILTEKGPGSATISCQGVGYGLAVSGNTFAALPEIGDAVSLWVHTHVTADSLRLFGFASAEERTMFLVLIQTNGVGPKLAVAILSVFRPDDLRVAVATGTDQWLRRVPGVGPKTAARLMVELKDRLPQEVMPSTGVNDSVSMTAISADLSLALQGLGFDRETSDQVSRDVGATATADTPLPELIRAALQRASSNSGRTVRAKR